MKYIIINNPACPDMECAIIFSELLGHSDVARGQKCVSAGFCNASADVWGESVTLKLKSRREDARLVSDAIDRVC